MHLIDRNKCFNELKEPDNKFKISDWLENNIKLIKVILLQSVILISNLIVKLFSTNKQN